MGLKDDLTTEVGSIFRSAWSERDGDKVPEPEDLKLANDAVKLTGTVLYADLADATRLVDTKTKTFAAEIYKSFLHCAAKIVRDHGGVITAYDGDRIMAVYIGKAKNTSAVKTALKIKWAVDEIVNPGIRNVYKESDFYVKHVVGIDTCELLVARTGVRGANDLVWVGSAANYAAKLCALSHSYATYITERVHNNMHDEVKFSANGKG
jgi:class 3 adenylate cyclase